MNTCPMPRGSPMRFDARWSTDMAFEFRLPDIGEGVVEGEVVKWLVKEGEHIREDQPMVEVMTDKATVEIPSPRAGVVARILVGEGNVCKVGQVMVAIDEGNGQSVRADGAAAAPPATASAKRAPVTSGAAQPTAQPASQGK